MKKMPESEEFRKGVERILLEAVEKVGELIEGSECTIDIDVLMRVEMGRWARELLGLALSERGSKARYGESVECRCGGRAWYKQNRGHTIGTVLPGREVGIKAAYYVCESCRRGVTPLLEEMGTDGDGTTVGLQQLLVLAGTIEPYREASENLLRKFACVDVGETCVRMKCLEEGAAVEEYLNDGEGMGSGLDRDQAIHVEIDGGMIHSNDRWQEVKLCVISPENGRVETSEGRGKLMNREIIAVRGGCDEFAESMDNRLYNYDLSYRKAVIIGDGAKWIWNLAGDRFPNRVEILDYYHATEHLWLCANEVFGETSEKAHEWVAEQETRLLDDRAGEVIEIVRLLKDRLRAKHKRKTLDDLAGYFQANIGRMRYKTYLQMGLSIGSGAVESAVKHVVQSRMKRPGMRWQNDGADSMIALRCLYRSTDRWGAYWNNRKSLRLAA